MNSNFLFVFNYHLYVTFKISIYFIRIPTKISLETCRCSILSDDKGQNLENPHGNHTSNTQSYTNKNLDVKELEMLLEPYFVQIDGTLNKLSTVRSLILPYHLL